MDKQSCGRFAIVPSRAVEDRRLTPAALRVLLCLGTYSDKDGWAWPAMRTMAERLGVSRQAVQQHVKQLANLGYIEIEERHRQDNSTTSSRYRLLFDRALFALNISGVDEGQDGVEGGQAQLAGGQAPELAGGQAPELAPILERPIERPTLELVGSGEPPADLFEEFWRIYPKRKPHGAGSKKTARQRFGAAIKRCKITPEFLIAKARAYAEYAERERIDPKYIKQAENWLSGERWNDDHGEPPAHEPTQGEIAG